MLTENRGKTLIFIKISGVLQEERILKKKKNWNAEGFHAVKFVRKVVFHIEN